MTNKTDTERRRKLNAELMKQRINFKDDTQCTNEATQTINPITGRQYGDEFITATDMGRVEQELKYQFKRHILDNYQLIGDKYIRVKETSTEYLDYQRALAIKEVRECKMPEFEYAYFLDTLDKLVAAYNESPNLTLQTIRDAEGLNLALEQVERAKEELETERIIKNKFGCGFDYTRELGKKLNADYLINPKKH